MSCKKTFRRAALALSLGLSLPSCAAYFADMPGGYSAEKLCAAGPDPRNDRLPERDRSDCTRFLTAGETALASRFFGLALDTTKIRLRFIAAAQDEGAANHQRNNITFFTPRTWSHDYAEESEPFKFGVFMHEIAHVFEHQNPFYIGLPSDTCKRYNYRLYPDSEFDDYCNEQRASIIEDYGRCFMHESGEGRRIACNEGSAKTDSHLKKIVEEQFPGARGLRVR